MRQVQRWGDRRERERDGRETERGGKKEKERKELRMQKREGAIKTENDEREIERAR